MSVLTFAHARRSQASIALMWHGWTGLGGLQARARVWAWEAVIDHCEGRPAPQRAPDALQEFIDLAAHLRSIEANLDCTIAYQRSAELLTEAIARANAAPPMWFRKRKIAVWSFAAAKQLPWWRVAKRARRFTYGIFAVIRVGLDIRREGAALGRGRDS